MRTQTAFVFSEWRNYKAWLVSQFFRRLFAQFLILIYVLDRYGY